MDFDIRFYYQNKYIKMDKLEEKIIEIIAKTLEVSVEIIDQDMAIGDIPEWNSLGHILIISALEKSFEIKFDPESIMDMEDVTDIIASIEERIKS
jgi:acyl carrier protein